MTWKPITEESLWDLINESCGKMDLGQSCFWDAIKISPQKWHLHPWGDDGGGFWVVAIIGSTVLWFNDIEDGFNGSGYTEFGVIDEYLCNQDELHWQLQRVMTGAKEGGRLGGFAGP